MSFRIEKKKCHISVSHIGTVVLMDNFPPKENWKLENYSWDKQYNYNSGTEFSSILKTTQVFPSRHIFCPSQTLLRNHKIREKISVI